MFFSKNLEKFSNLKHCFFSKNSGVSEGVYESLNCFQKNRHRKR